MKLKKENGKRTFFTILAFILAFIYAFIMSGGNVTNFIDFASLLFITILTAASLILSGQLSDYIRAIKIAMGYHDFTLTEYKISENVMNLSIKSIYTSAILGTLIGSIQIATFSNALEMTIASMRVAILTFLYALIINFFQYAFRSKLRKEIIYRDSQNYQDNTSFNPLVGELSRREFEVFGLAIDALSNKEISAKLYIAESTVKKHMQNILKKTECEDRNVLISKYKDR